jgi:hypothetical protein
MGFMRLASGLIGSDSAHRPLAIPSTLEVVLNGVSACPCQLRGGNDIQLVSGTIDGTFTLARTGCSGSTVTYAFTRTDLVSRAYASIDGTCSGAVIATNTNHVLTVQFTLTSASGTLVGTLTGSPTALSLFNTGSLTFCQSRPMVLANANVCANATIIGSGGTMTFCL